MAAIGKITLDINDYEKALEQVKRDTIEAAKRMQEKAGSAGNAFADVGKKLGKTGSLISAVSSEAGGAFWKLGNIIGAVTSGPVMALTAAIGGLVAFGVQVWDKMTLSAEEYAAKLDRAAAAADKHRAAVEKQVSEDQTYMDRLGELASKEALSNEAKAEAATLIANLTSRYGDLGLSIDKVTGKITGMDKAQAEMLKRIRAERQKAISDQIASIERQTANEAKNAIKGMYLFGNAFGGAENGLSRTREVFSGGTLQERIAYAEDLRDASKTTTDAEAWQKVIDHLQKALELQREYRTLSVEGMKTRTNAAETEATSQAKARQAAEDIVDDLQLQINMQQLINDGLSGEAEKLRIINSLRKQGIESATKENQIIGLHQQLSDAKFRQNQSHQAQSLYLRALRASGKGTAADAQEAIWAAKRAKGGALTNEETDRALNMAALASSLQNAASGPNFGDLAIRTNSLTARGGFATGAVTPDVDKYQRAQVEQGKQLVSIVSRIEKRCEELGIF